MQVFCVIFTQIDVFIKKSNAKHWIIDRSTMIEKGTSKFEIKGILHNQGFKYFIFQTSSLSFLKRNIFSYET